MQEANNTNTKKKMQTLDAETGAIVLVTPENLQPETAITLETGFRQYFADAESLRRRSLAVVVKDADDRKGMQEAREVRLALRNVRVAAEKTRKAMKEEGKIVAADIAVKVANFAIWIEAQAAKL